MSTELEQAWAEAPARIGESVVWRNVHLFSDKVEETAHDGHTGVIDAVIDDVDEFEIFPMFWITCSCGVRFQSFTEEIAA